MKKKNRIWIYSLAIIGVFLMIISGCNKNDNNSNPTLGTVIDIDGNIYHIVTIGTQVWMVENLKTTKMNDGTAIPLVTDGTAWSILTTPGYCWYKNDPATYKTPYGALYNWYAVNTGKLCPTGWHVPTDAEWTRLTTYLGGETVAGGKMKSTGTIGGGTGLWQNPNTGATNESGFTGVPAGCLNIDGTFIGIGYSSYCWSSSDYDIGSAWLRYLDANNSNVLKVGVSKSNGFSVRCLRDL
jgi:uncharacterized protein (TIGR02145 family)